MMISYQELVRTFLSVHRRLRLQLKAAGADLAGLDAERLVSRISRQVLVFGQLINRRGDHHRHIFRHVFHAGFILLTARRIERLAAAVGTRYRFKRFAVAEVRRDAVIEQVVDAAAPAELLVVILRRGCWWRGLTLRSWRNRNGRPGSSPIYPTPSDPARTGRSAPSG